MSGAPTPEQIARFWTEHPVGADYVDAADARSFLERYDRRRDATEPHIRGEIDRLRVRGLRVLEIGTGQGTESQRLMEAGADYHGLDFSAVAIGMLRTRATLFGLKPSGTLVGLAEALPYPDAAFDLVFSHGVIHHSPRIHAIAAEIHRVLRPGGRAVVMLYHRNSANYQVSIRLLRRLGAGLLFLPGATRVISRLTGEPPARLEAHVANMRREGLAYLRLDNFLHKATDGPHNVFSSVWSRAEASRLFSAFASTEFRVHLLNERHFPGIGRILPKRAREKLESRFGWHLWVTATKAAAGSAPQQPR